MRYDYLPTCNKDPSTQLYKFPGLDGMGYGGFWLFDTSRTQTSGVNCILKEHEAGMKTAVIRLNFEACPEAPNGASCSIALSSDRSATIFYLAFQL